MHELFLLHKDTQALEKGMPGRQKKGDKLKDKCGRKTDKVINEELRDNNYRRKEDHEVERKKERERKSVV